MIYPGYMAKTVLGSDEGRYPRIRLPETAVEVDLGKAFLEKHFRPVPEMFRKQLESWEDRIFQAIVEDQIFQAIVKEENTMKSMKDRLDLGNVVEFRNGDLAMLVKTKRGYGFAYGDDYRSLSLDDYSDDLKRKDTENSRFDIMRIYGLQRCFCRALNVSTEDRDILWERPVEPKDMTLAEIEKALGYPVKVVREV